MIDQNAFGYPGYNFMQGMAGPTGFSGQQPAGQMMLGQNMMQPQGVMPGMGQPQQQHGGLGAFGPMFGLAGMAMQNGGGHMLPYLLGGLGGGALFSLLKKHG